MHHVDLEKSINKVVNNHFLPHFKTLKNAPVSPYLALEKKLQKHRGKTHRRPKSTMAGAFGLASRCEFSQCQGALSAGYGFSLVQWFDGFNMRNPLEIFRVFDVFYLRRYL